ncbi:MAG TPA: hypothetical protein VJ762_08375 [Sphingobium sp.]|nr:hypothetical protein [Sphingobium sp.]
MLNDLNLRQLLRDVLHQRLPNVDLQEILTEQVIDSEGKDALRITLVIPDESVDAITGNQALDLIVDVQKGLSAQGDDRLAVIRYATPADLAEQNAQQDDD